MRMPTLCGRVSLFSTVKRTSTVSSLRFCPGLCTAGLLGTRATGQEPAKTDGQAFRAAHKMRLPRVQTCSNSVFSHPRLPAAATQTEAKRQTNDVVWAHLVASAVPPGAGGAPGVKCQVR